MLREDIARAADRATRRGSTQRGDYPDRDCPTTFDVRLRESTLHVGGVSLRPPPGVRRDGRTPDRSQAQECRHGGGDHCGGLFQPDRSAAGQLPDCIIAATAILSGAELATSNAGDFVRFQDAGLELAE